MNMRWIVLKSAVLLIVFTLFCGGIYPFLVTLVAQILFPDQANGSLYRRKGQVAGSVLLAQRADVQGYFQARPSACGYSTLPSRASHFAPTSAALRDSIEQRRRRFVRENGLADDAAVPVEMTCGSGSGLDPHISPRAARLQVERVARQRRLNDDQKQRLYDLIVRETEPRQWGMWGEPRVNVLKLNSSLNNDPEFRILNSTAQQDG
jgi:K+-transporting ATPase ATPase C chain